MAEIEPITATEAGITLEELPSAGPETKPPLALTPWWRLVYEYKRWIPSNEDALVSAESRILKEFIGSHAIVQGRVPLRSDPKLWMNSVLIPRTDNSRPLEAATRPPIVCTGGYGAALGFFFRNFRDLSTHFDVHAVDLLGWGLSARPRFDSKTTEEAEDFFVESLEEWREASGVDGMILMGHSLGGYVCANYALKYPERVRHLILVGPAGIPPMPDNALGSWGWKGSVVRFFWNRNITPQSIIRSLGPWGPSLVNRYVQARFRSYSQGQELTAEEIRFFSEYMYHNIAAPASAELCLNKIFHPGAYARRPLFERLRELKVPTSFIYGENDWMNPRAGMEVAKTMEDADVAVIPGAGHYVNIDNADGFYQAVLQACRRFLGKHS
eukprot:jgi/Mesvir1/18269/Mv09538-RA.1